MIFRTILSAWDMSVGVLGLYSIVMGLYNKWLHCMTFRVSCIIFNRSVNQYAACRTFRTTPNIW